MRRFSPVRRALRLTLVSLIGTTRLPAVVQASSSFLRGLAGDNDDLDMGRIINGNEVEDAERFPYYVALTDSFYQHVCGGSLIARDTVLTAAHCRGNLAHAIVGLHDAKKQDPNVDVEILEIQEQYQHPKWGEIPMAYDQMILILDREASSTPVRVNFDPNIPSDDTEFKIIGFGQTEDEDNSDVLKEIVVDLLPNDQCKKEFSGMIHPDMMCIMGRKNGRQCYGDSGGPWMITGATPKDDLQIGLVSWGTDGCLKGTPGVGARTSSSNWIRTVTCSSSIAPPDYFDCKKQTYSPAPTGAPSPPTISPAPTALNVNLELGIYFDQVPETISWAIRSKQGKVVYKEVRPGTYRRPIDHIFEEIFVPPGEEYEFIIQDEGGDGILGGGIVYDLYLKDENLSMKLFEGEGQFKKDQKETFYVPNLDEVPTPAPTGSPAPTAYTQSLFLTIFFDAWHQDISWMIVDAEAEDTVYAEKLIGEYRYGTKITEELALPPDKDYIFIMQDSFGDGLASPGYGIWMHDENGEKLYLFRGDGSFGSERRHEFYFEPLDIVFPETNATDVEDEI